MQVYSIVRADSDDRLHMVVEYCADGSLQSEHERGPMGLLRTREVVTDVCRGLDCVHARGMIHRDIKPANILCHSGRSKVGDFGLVSDSLVAGYASKAGYLDHIAIEVHNNNLTSAQSDVWALGMTVYRLLHGDEFYRQHFSTIDIPATIRAGGFALSLPWLPHIPEAWRRFVRKSMHDDTHRRYKTAFEMSQALARLPVSPDWQCAYTPTFIKWTRTKGGRQIEVEHTLISQRKHPWTAKSVGGKRTMSQGGGTRLRSKTQATQELENFFAGSR